MDACEPLLPPCRRGLAMSQVEERPVLDAMEAIELALIANGGSIKGRTSLQKIVYFISVQVPDNSIDYTHHFFGPYSVDVASGLANLQSLGFVYEIPIPAGRHTGYEYGITNYGREDAKRLDEMYPQEVHERIAKTVRACKEDLAIASAPRLLYAAKVHYVRANHDTQNLEKPQNEDETCEAARSFGWGLEPENVRSGFELLRGLGLER